MIESGCVSSYNHKELAGFYNLRYSGTLLIPGIATPLAREYIL